jgi:hypothetical protein
MGPVSDRPGAMSTLAWTCSDHRGGNTRTQA